MMASVPLFETLDTGSTRTHNQTNSTSRSLSFSSSLTKPGSRTEIAPKFQKPHTRPSLSQLFRSRSAPLRRPRPRLSSHPPSSDFRAFVQQKFATLNAAFKSLDSLLLDVIRACQRSPVIVVRPSQSCYLIGRQRSSQNSTPPSLAYCRGRAI